VLCVAVVQFMKVLCFAGLWLTGMTSSIYYSRSRGWLWLP